MNGESLAVVLVGTTASVITSVQVSRHVYDVYRSDNPSGVSLLTWEMALIQSIGLLVVSWQRRLVVATIINLYVGVAAAILLHRLGPGDRRTQARRGALLAGATTLGFAGLTITAGPYGAGTVGAAGSAVVWIPQGLHSLRRRSAAGLSWTAVGAGLLSSSLWLGYATAVGEWRLAVPPVSALGSLAITGIYGLAKGTSE